MMRKKERIIRMLERAFNKLSGLSLQSGWHERGGKIYETAVLVKVIEELRNRGFVF